jgi:hypothetical protein
MPFCKHVVNSLGCVFVGKSTSEMNGFKGGAEVGLRCFFCSVARRRGGEGGWKCFFCSVARRRAVRADGGVSFAEGHDAGR